MKLLISANSFYPAVGGYERVAMIMAQQLAARGHQIKIVTWTPGEPDPNLPFQVYRRPDIITLFKLIRWSDVYLQNSVSFNFLWPRLFCWRPLVFVHHNFYRSSRDTLFSWRPRLKRLATLFGANISVSRALAETLPGKSYVTLNPYSDDLFFRDPNIRKDRDLIFVGRIVSDKGIDVLTEALAKLRDRGLRPTLTVAGSGPEEPAIRRRVKELDLDEQVTFAGQVVEKLNELLNAHRIMVVPSREGETFGVVALEGIACGCVVVGSIHGGLPEAIGPCGRTFTNGDPSALAEVLHDLLAQPEKWNDHYFVHAKAHLDSHRPSVVADRYLDVLAGVLKRKAPA